MTVLVEKTIVIPEKFIQLSSTQGTHIDFELLVAALQKQLTHGETLERVEVLGVQFNTAKLHSYFEQVQAAEHLLKTGEATYLNLVLEMVMQVHLETTGTQYRLTVGHRLMFDLTYEVRITRAFTRLAELTAVDVECIFPYQLGTVTGYIDTQLRKEQEVNGVVFKPKEPTVLVNPLDTVISSRIKRLQADKLSNFQLNSRRQRLAKAGAFQSLPPTVETVSHLSSPAFQVFRQLIVQPNPEECVYLYFTHYFALLAKFNKQNTPIGSTFLYDLSNESLEQAGDILKKSLPPLPIVETLQQWLTLMDGRRKVD